MEFTNKEIKELKADLKQGKNYMESINIGDTLKFNNSNEWKTGLNKAQVENIEKEIELLNDELTLLNGLNVYEWRFRDLTFELINNKTDEILKEYKTCCFAYEYTQGFIEAMTIQR